MPEGSSLLVFLILERMEWERGAHFGTFKEERTKKAGTGGQAQEVFDVKS